MQVSAMREQIIEVGAEMKGRGSVMRARRRPADVPTTPILSNHKISCY